MIASAVTTPQPPAVVSTTTFGPVGSGWVANVAAASKASSTVAARITPAWRHTPSNTRSSLAERARVGRRGPLAAGGGAALHQHERHAPRSPTAHRVEERATVGDPLDVGEADGGGVVVGDRSRGSRPR